MDSIFKKVLPALALSLASVTSVVNADDDVQIRNLNNRVSALEQSRNSGGMINPAARPVVKDGMDFSAQVEALLFRTTEDGLDYAIDTTSGPLNGKVKNSTYDWSWGFRLGLGANLPHDGWDVLANWTWFRSNERHVDVLKTPTAPLPTQLQTTETGTVNDAFAHSKLLWNNIDLEMGREFFVSKWLMVRPLMGLRGTWVHRHFTTDYKGGTLTSDTANSFYARYRGIGLRGGFDTQWGLGNGFSIFGQMSGSLLYGKQRSSDTQSNASATAANANNRASAVRSMADLALGLRWDSLLNDDKYRLRLQAGWEEHVLFGFNRNMSFTRLGTDVGTSNGAFSNNRGDLAFSGLSLQARFDF